MSRPHEAAASPFPSVPGVIAGPASEGRRIGLLLLASALLLAGTLGFDFVFDDNLAVLRDAEAVAQRGIHRPVQVGPWLLGFYRPLIAFTYRLDWLVWGRNPAGYHLTNLLWHLAAVLLVFELARRTRLERGAAAIAAALFAVLPAHAEAIGWIQGRVDLVSTVFVLAALATLLRAWETPGRPAWSWAVLAALSWLLALLAKESALTFPLILGPWLLGGLRSGASGPRRQVALLAPLVPALALYAALRQTAMGPGWISGGTVSDPGARALALLIGLGEYARLLAWPPPALHFFRWLPTHGIRPSLVAGLLLALGAGAGALRLHRRGCPSLAAWVLYVPLALAPALAFGAFATAWSTGVFVAERYLYLASVGWCMVAAALLVRALRAVPQSAWSAALLGALLLGYGSLLALRLQPWADPVSHYRAMQAQPDLAPALRLFVHNELGRTYVQRGEWAAARQQFLAGLALEPRSAMLHNNLGAVLVEEGRPAEAVPWLAKALVLQPGYTDAARNLAAAQAAQVRPAAPPATASPGGRP